MHIQAITHQEYLANYTHLSIEFDIQPTKFGKCFIAMLGNKVCHLAFADNNEKEILSHLICHWPNSTLENKPIANETINAIFTHAKSDLSILIKGTDFQVKVWKKLLHIPQGNTISYTQVANDLGNPQAIRAVANAIAANNIAYLIPCHRVIGKSGNLTGYRYGLARKKAMLESEKISDLKRTCKITGDIMEPIDVEWELDSLSQLRKGRRRTTT